MSKKQLLNKFKHKQKIKKEKEIPKEVRIKNLLQPLSESKDATNALKNAIQKTIKA